MTCLFGEMMETFIATIILSAAIYLGFQWLVEKLRFAKQPRLKKKQIAKAKKELVKKPLNERDAAIVQLFEQIDVAREKHPELIEEDSKRGAKIIKSWVEKDQGGS